MAEVGSPPSKYNGLNNRPWADVTAYGAKGDGVTNDTAAFLAAIAAGNRVFVPAGTFVVATAVVISAFDKVLEGAGMGVTIIKNTGTGNAIECKSAGGVDSTKLRIQVRNLTIQGNGSSLNGLYVYDCADCLFENIESKSNGAHGVLVEMAVDCTFSDFYCTSNTGDGFKLSAALKNAVEFTSNANQLRRVVSNSNTANGLQISRSFGNMVLGGEISSNGGKGIYCIGAYRNYISGAWIEANTGNAFETASSGAPTTIHADYNKFIANMVAGNNDVVIGDGTANVVDGNYIGRALTISNGASTPNTVIGQGNSVVGTFTDNGNATVSMYSPAAMYWKVTSNKRLQIGVGTNVDITSDIAAIRICGMKSMATSLTPGSNICGFVDITGAATTGAVTFGTAEPDASYNVMLGCWDSSGAPAANSHINWITARATTGFTVNCAAAPGVGTTLRVFWFLVRV